MGIYVNEIFYSIQGESLASGRPCVFIRLTGCNLRCVYCDTAYAYNEGRNMDLQQVLQAVSSYSCQLVEVTGGEPLVQPESIDLIKKLLDLSYNVLLETNGSIDIQSVDPRCTRIIDIKCPSSGESGSFCYQNLTRATANDQFKFVLSNREDFEFAKKQLELIPKTIPRDHVLFSPVYAKLSPEQLADWILTSHLPVRLHLQLHKIIWPHIDRGV